MRHRSFGPTGRAVPVIGLGTALFEREDPELVTAAIRRAMERGMTHVDTAETYGKGRVEELLGQALAGYRGEVFLASKVHPAQATFAGTLRACEHSLRRLRTDRLDLYLLHWRGALPLEETFRAFETLKRDGKILAWGVSNFDVAELATAIEVAGPGAIACNQVPYNLDERDAEHVLQVFCERNRVAFVGYSPLASGRFPAPGSHGGAVLETIAAARRVSARTVALAYLTRGAGTFTIPKTARAAHVDALAAAGDLALADDEIAAIQAAFPLGPPRSVPYV